jgi:hypothetical protein
MNQDLKSILAIFADKLPTISALIPLPYASLAGGVVASIAKHFLGDANATTAQVAAAVQADPVKAVEALKPLDDHLAAAGQAAVVGSVNVATAELPAATVAVNDAIAFQTDTRAVSLGQIDNDGRAVLQIYLTAEQLNELKMSA